MTNETKFTDGPWATSGLDQTIVVLDKDEDNICIISRKSKNYYENAHLISAAPELYEACDYALGHLLDNDKYKNDDVLWSMVSHFVNALNKAKGA